MMPRKQANRGPPTFRVTLVIANCVACGPASSREYLTPSAFEELSQERLALDAGMERSYMSE
jgi:hypothetical protein